GAHPGDRPRLRPRAMTGRARALTGQPEGHRGAVDGVVERQRRLGFHVRATARAGLLRGPSAAAEHPAEQVAHPAPGTGAGVRAADQVAQVEREAPRATRATRARRPEAPAEQRASIVVLLALLGVGQDVVRLGDLLEPLLGLRVTLVGVRVVLA